jgi:FMN-dependent NADH-azoreductase
MKLLHIDTSILGDNSVSRTLSKAAVERLREGNAGLEVIYRDLVADPIGHLTGRYLAGRSAEVQHDQALQAELSLGGRALEEFLAADVVVIGVALYNFTIPSQLKAWIDRILVAGKTFRYTAEGPQGLAGGKRVVLAIARGGFYGAGTPFAAFEHAESYLRSVFAFIGVTDPQVIVAEGLAVGPEQRADATKSALAAISALKAA